MADLDFLDVPLQEVVAMGARGLRRFQRDSDMNVLVVPIGSSGLTSVVGVAPNGHCFGQSWWLGESYAVWQHIASCDEGLAQTVSKAVSRDGVAYDDIPLELLSPGGWFVHRHRNRDAIPAWMKDWIVCSTVPSSHLNQTVLAIQASKQLVFDHLFVERGGQSSRIADRYGVTPLERAFPIGQGEGVSYRAAYVRPGECEMVQQWFDDDEVRRQKKYLADQRHALEEFAECIHKEGQRPSQRQQYLFFLNAFEFDASLASDVQKVNLQRAALLARANLPHFMPSLTTRLPEMANKVKRRFELLPNDIDWMEWLREVVRKSFSPKFKERVLVEKYLDSMKSKYECFGGDFLPDLLPYHRAA